jgi:hypothetical protein
LEVLCTKYTIFVSYVVPAQHIFLWGKNEGFEQKQ